MGERRRKGDKWRRNKGWRDGKSKKEGKKTFHLANQTAGLKQVKGFIPRGKH